MGAKVTRREFLKTSALTIAAFNLIKMKF